LSAVFLSIADVVCSFKAKSIGKSCNNYLVLNLSFDKWKCWRHLCSKYIVHHNNFVQPSLTLFSMICQSTGVIFLYLLSAGTNACTETIPHMKAPILSCSQKDTCVRAPVTTPTSRKKLYNYEGDKSNPHAKQGKWVFSCLYFLLLVLRHGTNKKTITNI
jgi:hypothetical protein